MKSEEQIHKWKMEEIEARRKAETEVENLKFDHQLQLQRIRNASIEKNLLRKEKY